MSHRFPFVFNQFSVLITFKKSPSFSCRRWNQRISDTGKEKTFDLPDKLKPSSSVCLSSGHWSTGWFKLTEPLWPITQISRPHIGNHLHLKKEMLEILNLVFVSGYVNVKIVSSLLCFYPLTGWDSRIFTASDQSSSPC